MKYSNNFSSLVKEFVQHDVGFPDIKQASIAQFILESARGTSELASEHNNFAGMKWRPEMEEFAEKVLVEAPSETAYFCKFAGIEEFVIGYWRFLDRRPYNGWEEHTSNAYEFIDFIAPIWAADKSYDEKLIDLLGEAEKLIGQTDGEFKSLLKSHKDEDEAPCCEGMAEESFFGGIDWEKPKVIWDPSPFIYSRNGQDIDTIVMHYTTSRNMNGTISWFKHPDNKKRTATHYIIGRDGTIVQMIKDSKSCRHANSKNKRSIGIEHSAQNGDAMTSKQERSSIALVRWLMQEYDVEKKNVIGHKCAPRDTQCPGDLFKNYGATSSSSCKEVTKAIQKWVNEKVNANGELLLS